MNCKISRLSDGIPQIPPPPSTTHSLARFRYSLPIWKLRNDIISLIETNPVTLISGDTGCGKTTQVPQFILDHHHINRRKCQIIVAEPRRLAALSVAQRVSQERGEPIGHTIGYHIRLESNASPSTLVTFCTNGVLLRTLMGGVNALNNVSHVIIDEVHERDRFSDFLLLTLRNLMVRNRHLKLILMSATFDTERFSNYFNGCALIKVPRLTHTVQVHFLEDILRMTDYLKASVIAQLLASKSKKERKSFNKSMQDLARSDRGKCSNSTDEVILSNTSNLSIEDKEISFNVMDEFLEKAFTGGADEDFEELLSLIINDNYPVDYQHSETGMTALIASAARGKLYFVETLLGLGSNASLKANNGWSALNFTQEFGFVDISDLLIAYSNFGNTSSDLEKNKDLPNDLKFFPEISEEDKQLIAMYNVLFPSEDIDMNLILELINHIIKSEGYSSKATCGAILVFLPGYDDIVYLRDRIKNDGRFKQYDILLLTLHAQMLNSDQRKIFEPVKPGVRKIILSTNLAETSVTIDDVVYVIDSGRVKEQSYDHNLGVSMLKGVWISQANAIQRRGRAGRCQAGYCYHIFSKSRFSTMPRFQVPEILRVPIHELCLQTKLLSSQKISIVDFLSQALDPPPINILMSSIQLLKTIDALDSNENLTEVGLHLLDLPLEPNLGKMVLNAVVLKCLDPVLTIVCGLTYRDLFLIPIEPDEKLAASKARVKLSCDTYSDHMVFLRVFQGWQKARQEGFERDFNEQNFIRPATMEMISGMRAQLLGQLRASGFVRAKGPGNIGDLNFNSENWGVVKAALCGGAYPNIIKVGPGRKNLITNKESKVLFHPSSALVGLIQSNDTYSKKQSKLLESLPSEWFIFDSLTRIGRTSYARCCTLLSPITVAIFSGPLRSGSDVYPKCSMSNSTSNSVTSSHFNSYSRSNSSFSSSKLYDGFISENEPEDPRLKVLEIDDWIKFSLKPENFEALSQLREMWHSLFLRKITDPSKSISTANDHSLKVLVEVITNGEKALRLSQPSGVGKRPRNISISIS